MTNIAKSNPIIRKEVTDKKTIHDKGQETKKEEILNGRMSRESMTDTKKSKASKVTDREM